MNARLILGTAKGYQFSQIRDFVRSWNSAVKRSTLVLFVDRTLASGSRTQLEAAGVILHTLPRLLTERSALARRLLQSFHLAPVHRWLAARMPPAGEAQPRDVLRWFRLAEEFHHIACSRYSHYLNYLQEAGDSVTHVLLTDVRDVLFHADPFADAPTAGLVCGLETSLVTLSTQPANAGWLDYAYGRERWLSFSDRRVSCSGATLGTLRAIRQYLTCMSAEIIRLTPRLVGQDGLDQGVHNYLLNTGRLPPVRLVENGEGVFATLHGEDLAVFAQDVQGRLLNRDGRLVPLVHQYDRHPALAASLVASLPAEDQSSAASVAHP